MTRLATLNIHLFLESWLPSGARLRQCDSLIIFPDWNFPPSLRGNYARARKRRALHFTRLSFSLSLSLSLSLFSSFFIRSPMHLLTNRILPVAEFCSQNEKSRIAWRNKFIRINHGSRESHAFILSNLDASMSKMSHLFLPVALKLCFVFASLREICRQP